MRSGLLRRRWPGIVARVPFQMTGKAVRVFTGLARSTRKISDLLG
jgi:hypothetical protein